MKAWEITGSFGLDNLKLVERDDPKAPPGHVVVKLSAVSLNYRDLLMVNGLYNPKQPLPLVPCSDGAGEVVDVGDGVSLKRGERVVTMFAQGWQGGAPSLAKVKRTLGGPVSGTLATHIVLPVDGVAPIPDGWSDVEASTLPCAAVTAWSGLVEQAQLRAGQRVLVLGTGGVSTFALQIARIAGAQTACVTAKPEEAKKLGLVDVVIDRTKNEDWAKEVRRVWPEGADVVVEVGGAGTLTRSIKSTCIGGTVLVIGVLAGGTDTVNVIPVLMQQIRLQGVLVGNRDGYLAMSRAFVANKVKPHVDRTIPFDKAVDAFRAMGSAAHVGKIVVTI